MSLLIKDMDMPKNCMECICLEAFDDEIYGRQFFCNLLGIDALAKEHSRHKNCPLTEIPTPHGRLIDADRLIAVLKSTTAISQSDYDLFNHIVGLIEHQPTVIGKEMKQ